MVRSEAEKAQIASIAEELIGLTGKFCDSVLNAECAELAEKLILKMKRKRDVPFLHGRPDVWAGAIIYALCQINFLFDPKAEAHTTPDQIAGHFGVGRNYVSQKAKQVRDMFRLRPWDPDFSTREMLESDPALRMVECDGAMVPMGAVSPLAAEFARRFWRRK